MKTDLYFETHHMKIPYTIRKSKRRSYAISIEDNGNMKLSVPLFTTRTQIAHILMQKEDWIFAHYQKILTHTHNLPPPLDPLLVKKWEKKFRQEAKHHFQRRVTYYADLMQVHYSKITIRNQKTRWGSCSSLGTLSFNWRLMLAPSIVLDYVIVHELCHRKEMNHSKAFWNAVEMVLPDYKIHRKWLTDHGHELTLAHYLYVS